VRIEIALNGEDRVVEAGTTVDALVTEVAGGGSGRGVAVALDGEVVPRSAWAMTALVDGARVELLVAVQGG
jgi:sulfur carrier protein